MSRAHFPSSQPSDIQDVLDLRVPRSSSLSSGASFSSSAEEATILPMEEDELSGYDDQFDNYVDDTETHCHGVNFNATETNAKPTSSGQEGATNKKVRQRFGPEENYLHAVQVNADTPYAAGHGDINKQWRSVADKLNSSPNFCMKPIKGVTAKARFKTLLDKHRS
ncbi:hypothetical protein V7S43_004777 [Phytophthora oleae]|uniref:Myb-like domain-containing protein n=1 Tax=Phytophthora oleae TaxID=2107226 RepID=A0ABD3FU76_9STRA